MQIYTEDGVQRVAHALARHQPTTPGELADLLGLDPSTISRHLARLVADGHAVRNREGKRVIFSTVPRLEVSLVAPIGPTGEWLDTRWAGPPPADWRFPLVGRVSDGPGRAAVVRLLDRCDREGLFHLDLVYGRRSVFAGGTENEGPANTTASRASWGGFTFIVFGSCATGQARTHSDVDVVVRGPPQDALDAALGTFTDPPRRLIWQTALADLVAGLNLQSRYRHVDASYSEREDLTDLPPQLRTEVYRTGITVYTSLPGLPWVEGGRDGDGTARASPRDPSHD